METPAVIDRNHPSFGCTQAWFLFAISHVRDGHVSKLLLVEAQRAWAVQTLERLVLEDGAVSDNCRLMAVHRNCQDVGIRSDLVEEIPYVDFMMDIVDQGRILADALVSTSFRRSLTEEERSYAVARVDAMTGADRVPTSIRKNGPKAAPVIMAAPAPSEMQIRLMGALLGLSFKRAEVQKFVDGLGDEVEKRSLEDLVRLGISKLAA